MANGIATEFTKFTVRRRLFSVAPPPVRVGGRYRLTERVDAGATGVVFAAQDEKLNRTVALKVLHDRFSAEGFGAEAQALAQVSHENVVAVHDVGVDRGQIFLAMAFVEGETLRQWCQRKRPSWREALAKWIDAGRGLAAVHAQGLIHRDFKPDNVLVDDAGRVQLVDFGLAMGIEDRLALNADADPSTPVDVLTATRAWYGTPAYMSPEQFSGVVDPRSDQFAFAVSLFEALYAQRPFAGETIAEVRAQVSRGEIQRVSRSSVPRRIHRAVLRALNADPRERFSDMASLLDELSVARRPRKGLRAVAAAVVAALVGAFALLSAPTADPCLGVDRGLDDVWNDARRASWRARLEAASPGQGEVLFHRTAARLDAFAERWRQRRVESCRATFVSRQQSRAAHDLRMMCLDGRRGALKALTDVLVDSDARVIRQAERAVASLPDLERCDDVQALLAAMPLPEDPERRRRVATLRTDLARAYQLTDYGAGTEAVEVARGAYDAARALEYGPVLAEAALRLGRAHTASGQYELGCRRLEEASDHALAAQHLVAAAEAWSSLVWSYALFRRDDDKAELVGRLARAMVEGLPGEVRLKATVLGQLGWLEARRGRFEEAIELLRRGRALRVQEYGPDHPILSYNALYVAEAHLELGDLHRALELLREGQRIYDASSSFPNRHRAIFGFRIAETLELLGYEERALDEFTRFVELSTRVAGPNDDNTIAGENRRILLLTRLGRLREAKATADAIHSVVEALNDKNEERAYFSLARAGLEGALGRAEQGLTDARRWLAILDPPEAEGLKLVGDPKPKLVGLAYEIVGDLQLRLGRREVAHRAYRRAWGARRARYSEQHPIHLRTLEGLEATRGPSDEGEDWGARAVALRARMKAAPSER